MKLNTSKNAKEDAIILQTDYSNLGHICDELQNALDSTKANYARRVRRNI